MPVVHESTGTYEGPGVPSSSSTRTQPTAAQEIPKNDGVPSVESNLNADPAPCPSPESDDLADCLRPCPEALVEEFRANNEVSTQVQKIMASKTQCELYHPAGVLLTLISRAIFESFSADDKLRLHLEPGRPIVFLSHYSCPLAHFPNGNPTNSPSLVGVFELPAELHFPMHDDGSYRDIPYHRVETVVELGHKRRAFESRRRASSDIHHILQARSDRPACYAMSATPGCFELFYGSPLGLQTSQVLYWTDLETLCAWVYSLYDPPDGHILYDRTISWQESPGTPFSAPTWTVTTEDLDLSGAVIEFVGYPYGRQTTVFRAAMADQPGPVIIKDYFFDDDKLYEEAEVLHWNVHGDGFVPGVVRLLSFQNVANDGKMIIFRHPTERLIMTKRRLVFADYGVGLENAKSVNDLLMAIYDILEVHRTVAARRHVLHRDMSLANILMYPQLNRCEGVPWMKDMPPLIDDVLGVVKREGEAQKARGMMIDFDHSSLLCDGQEPSPEAQQDKERELRCRIGTPTYIARAVNVAAVPYYCDSAVYYQQMPLLVGKAKELYLNAYGNSRYEQYNDNPDGPTFHGGYPRPGDEDELCELAERLQFHHRWEHDAESVFWAMYSILLRVHPQNAEETPLSKRQAEYAWDILKKHVIPKRNVDGSGFCGRYDERQVLLHHYRKIFSSAFLPAMRDVAFLLHSIAAQVNPTYALMKPCPPFEDHLHEAMQRLILQYLVDHEDEPIPLTPGVLRSIEGEEEEARAGLKRARDQSDRMTHRPVFPKLGTEQCTRPRENDADSPKGE
ncbi:hypothetical protein C8Q73DRAFT_51940 [Cubamyces lactineus]|nr:hypothetical protein C8Q73DRAFT_51940 [Cubamyces lactineus]